ncbi:MAG TPA: amino acid adenylation domain-containing protein [Thermoanaerobaculia bacterium]|jgi:amino acid adenylation domain-containing protein
MNPADFEALYELSPLQQGMLFHSRYSEEPEVYFTQFSCTLQGPLDIEAFAAAWQRVAERQPVLRTSFHWRELDKPLQMVHRRVELPFAVLDWNGLPAAERERRLEDLLRQDRRRGFDVGRPPLMRLTLARLGPDEHQLTWSFHHLLLDGWSLPLVLREVFALYESRLRGAELQLPPVRPYRDYILWLQRQDLGRAEAFWRQTLAGFTVPTPLPGERTGAPAAGREGEYARRDLHLSAATTAALQELARRHQLTPATLVQGAWAVLLARAGGEEDVVFGSTSSGRPAALPGVESMVGLFISTLPVRARVEPAASALAWLRNFQDEQLQAREFEYAPLVQIQGWSEVPRGRPLFESLVVYENFPLEPAASREDGGPALRVIGVRPFQKTNYPLTLVASPQGDRLRLRMAFDGRRFEADAADRLLASLDALLEGLAADPTVRIEDLPLLSAAGRAEILAWSGAGADYPSDLPVHRLFERRAAEAPDAPALIAGERRMTYGELNERAGRLARRLRRLGVGPDSLVALRMERSPEAIVAILSILKAGGAYVPLDPGNPAELLTFQLEDTGAAVLLTQPHLRGRLPEGMADRLPVLCLDADGEAGGEEDAGGPAPALEPGGGHLAYLIYTSGSTGRPKGVMIEHRSLVHRVLAMAELFGLRPGDCQSQIVSLSFDVSCEEIFVPLAVGAALAVPPPAAAMAELIDACERTGVTKMNVPASLLNQMADAVAAGERRIPPSLSVLVSGAESPSLAKLAILAHHGRAAGRPVTFFNVYGPTEATILATAEAIPLDPQTVERIEKISIGRPIAGARVYLLDAALEPVPVRMAGEIFLGGIGVARGYLRRPDLTAERFVPDPFGAPGERLYRTGDLARRLPDGRLVFLGRTDHQVKIRGLRVELGEIQAALERHPAVSASVAVVREDTPGDRRLVAYFVPQEEARPSVTELRSFLLERLPEALIPSAFVALDTLPLNRNGKVDRKALPPPAGVRPDLAGAYAEPATPLERFLADLWQEILHIDRVGARDGFFELGGDSLKAAVFINRLEKKLGRYVYVTALFDAPDVASFARYLGENHPEAVEKIFGRESLPAAAPAAVERPARRIGPAETARLRALIPPLSPFPERPAAPNPPAAFVLSPPRSGSTLLRVMLAGNPRLFAPPELDLLSFNTLAERKAAFSGKFSFWLEGLLRAVMEVQGCDAGRARGIVEELERRGTSTKEFYRRFQEWIGDRLLVDKTPSYALDPAILARAEEDFADARFIHLVRHPLGMMLSFEEAKIDQLFFRHGHDFTPRELGELVWWVSHRNILDFLAGLPAGRWHRIHFEDLVRDPEPALRGLCGFLGIELHPDMLEPYKSKERRMTDGIHPLAKMLGDVKFHEHSRVDPTVADRWRTAFQGHRLGEETLALAEKLGYGRPGEEPERPARRGAVGLVTIQPRGDQPPFVCVHPAGGTVLCYAELARELGPGQPFYGLQAQGLVEGEEPLTRMEEIVERALAALTAADPAGPYRLGGWSFGGYVAYEMARRLAAQGRPVELLALFDTSAARLGRAGLWDDAELLARAFQEILPVSAAELRALPAAEDRLRRVIELARAAGQIPPDFDLRQARRYLAVFQGNQLALQGFRPGPYPGRITLFRAEQGVEAAGDETLGWSGLAAAVEVHLVPGRHEHMIFQPAVRVLAARLRACLDAAVSAEARAAAPAAG